MDLKPGEILTLAKSDGFQQIIASDPELDRLEAQMYNPSAEKRSLLDLIGLDAQNIGHLPVRPLTPAKWAFLWVLDSPYVIGGTVRRYDQDVFLYVLSRMDLRKDIPCSLSEIPSEADAFADATGKDMPSLHEILTEKIRQAFAPMAMLPSPDTQPDNPEERTRYDCDWIVRLCAEAAREGGMTLERILHMPLSFVCMLWVNGYRREATDGHLVRRKPSPELAAEIMQRTAFLGKTFLHGKNNADDHQTCTGCQRVPE